MWTWGKSARVLVGVALGLSVAILVQGLKNDEPLLGVLSSVLLAAGAIGLSIYLRRRQDG